MYLCECVCVNKCLMVLQRLLSNTKSTCIKLNIPHYYLGKCTSRPSRIMKFLPPSGKTRHSLVLIETNKRYLLTLQKVPSRVHIYQNLNSCVSMYYSFRSQITNSMLCYYSKCCCFFCSVNIMDYTVKV